MAIDYGKLHDKHPGTPPVEPNQEEKAEEQSVVVLDPMDPSHLVEPMRGYKMDLARMYNEIDELKVIDDATSAQATAMATQAQQFFNKIEKQRKAIVAPYNNVTGFVNGFAKAVKDDFTNIKGKATAKNRDYLIEQDRKRREAEARADKQAADHQAELEKKRKAAEKKGEDPAEVISTPIVPVVPKSTTVKTESGSQQIEYEFVPELVNVHQLSEACIKARFKQIDDAVMPWARAQVKAGIHKIPGFVVSKQPKVKTRAAKSSQKF